nr:uncharacterized protein LOC109163268 [Ipomoea batatas]
MSNPKNQDPGWDHGTPVLDKGTTHVRCKYCDKITKGGIYRHKLHLVGGNRNVMGCKKCPQIVRDAMKEYMLNKKQRKEEVSSTATMGVQSKFEFDEEGDEGMDFPEVAGNPGMGCSMGSSNKSIKGPMDLYFNTKEHQSLKRSIGGKDLMELFPSLYWTPCAAHCINLMFKDIFEIRHFSLAYKRALKLSVYIHSKTKLLNWLRKYTGKRDLVKIVQMPNFWNTILEALKIGGPLISTLRLVDGDVKASMGYIYPAMEITKQAIEKAFNNNSSKYKKVFEIIDRRWSSQLRQPLHAAAYYLNPDYFRYRDETPIAPSVHSGEVVNGFYECLERLVPDPDLHEKITKEVTTWEVGTGLFGLAVAKKQRGSKAPGIPEDANDELVFEDGDGLTWGEIAKFSGANETPYSLRHTSKRKEKVGSSSRSKGKEKQSPASSL